MDPFTAAIVIGAVTGISRFLKKRQQQREEQRRAQTDYDAAKYRDSERLAEVQRRRDKARTILQGLASAYSTNPGVQRYNAEQQARLSEPVRSTGFPAFRDVPGPKFWEEILGGTADAYVSQPPLSSKPASTTSAGGASSGYVPAGAPSSNLAPPGGITRTPWNEILQSFDADSESVSSDQRRRRRRTSLEDETGLY